MKKKKCKPFSKRLIALLLSLFTVISTLAIPLTAFADGDLSEVSGASNISIKIETHYGHELHYTTVNGTSYPLFCIEYGTTSPSSSVLAGRKEMASAKAVEAARWIYAGYYMEHGNSLNWLDMAYCQKKVWAIMGDNVSWDFSNSGYTAWCNNAQANMEKMQIKPSFNNQTIASIMAGESKTLTDTNGVFKDYPAFTENSNGIKIVHAKNSNDLVITVDKTCTKTSFSINNNKYYKDGTGNDDDLLVYYPVGSSSYQKLIYSAYFDPVSFYIDGTVVPLGTLDIVKKSEDNIVSGINFTVTGTNYSQSVTTDSSGKVEIKYLKPGTYTVTEAAIDRYVTPKSQTVTVNSNRTSTVTFNNVLKKFRVTVTKTDSQRTVAQGDATLQGAVYGLYNNGKLVDSYTTDKNGKFTTDYYVCGGNWTVKEISPSPGYLLNSTSYTVGAEAKLYTLEYNTTSANVTEDVSTSTISIIKHSNTCDEQIETPEKGAEFQVYLKSAGSYANANDYEKDVLVTDEDGFAQTKSLPYGVYTIHQTKGLDGTKFVSDFDVFLETNGKNYKFLLNNPPFSSYIKVVKQDIETGKPIVSSSAGYQIYDPDGNLVTMSYTYPTPTTIDTFYTNSEGYLITPDKLSNGKGYSLVEVQAPFGYALDSTPIKFDVTNENSTDEYGVTVINVVQRNSAQMGSIAISKTGEVFASVQTDEEVYTPVYEEQGIADAEFEVYAAEDIYTGDGTLRAAEGDLVDTIVTDSTGNAETDNLYLGKYTIVETQAPYGFVSDKTEYEVELVYAGQNVKKTSTDLSLYNERQLASMSLAKVLEQDELFEIGMNDEIEAVEFSVYANEDVTAQDGEVIPADGLVTTANCDMDGYIVFDCDIPVGFNWYVQETAADEHYMLSEEKYEFSTEYQGQDVDVIDIQINDGQEIINDLITGDISGIKLDDSGDGLPDALIGLFRADTEDFSVDVAIATTVSGENGYFAFTDVPFGNYIVKEIEAPEKYMVDENNYPVDITEDGQLVEIEITNILKRGSVHGLKINDSGDVLEGAVIGLFSDDTEEFTEDTAIETTVSDENGEFYFVEIPAGGYIVKEFAAPEKYLLDVNNYTVEITDNEQIVTLEIVNLIKRGSIHGLKVDNNGQPLEGSVIGLFAADAVSFTKDDVLMIATSAENGEFEFANLPVDDYIVMELESPEGYILNTNKFKVSITENEQVVEIKIVNTIKIADVVITHTEKNKKSPLTGADNTIILTLLLFFSIMTAVTCIAVKKRKKNNNVHC